MTCQYWDMKIERYWCIEIWTRLKIYRCNNGIGSWVSGTGDWIDPKELGIRELGN